MEADNKPPEQREPNVNDPGLARQLLQAFCLGIVTGNRDLRDAIEGSDFTARDYECAFNSLVGGQADYLLFARLLEEEFGLVWEKKDGLPAEAAFKRLKIDSKKSRLMRDLIEAFDHVDGKFTDFHNEKFFEDVKEAVKRLDWVQKPLEDNENLWDEQ